MARPRFVGCQTGCLCIDNGAVSINMCILYRFLIYRKVLILAGTCFVLIFNYDISEKRGEVI